MDPFSMREPEVNKLFRLACKYDIMEVHVGARVGHESES